ncbi:hypothetical protein [Lentilactobacillus sp. SPB1-3]|uniref:Uncharacterized protein n=1 Tax=Lentilactobacillus terminaliae TaxID=3003483 RepID=A0ACD5DG54_9LACO|nr:hypothetical protein [Lentilactobacillus sp. SPB1-3]MCZ0977924.1 hypothetical protein [Lentilactobacillus sp. SPB1-3]
MKINKIVHTLFIFGLIIVLIVAILLIFNRQFKNQLVKSYQPKISRQVVDKNEKLLEQNKHTSNKSNARTVNQASSGISFDFDKVVNLDF